jgi:S1-C subfamily serine protease
LTLVDKLRRCVGKISIEGENTTGTGFFISPGGDVLTCWHVISDGVKLDSNGVVREVRKMFIELTNGEKIELLIPAKFFLFPRLNIAAASYDFCVLSPVRYDKKVDYLKLGKFENINEGDQIYTAGYPLGISNQFISKGILSTKYIDSSVIAINQSQKYAGNVKRTVALLDLTINKGNSGGPIIRIGKTLNDDEVIGIADFQINPLAGTAEEMLGLLKEKQYLLAYNEKIKLNLSEILKLFAKSIIYSSNGISGCVSIDHFLQATQ